ncbi:MAG: hypothetical protein WAW63_04205 [Candidatus Saccharimonadales bacterium]|jgi:hypothetical protein|nr:MAG: hypothetical protein IPP75_00240 [Candidatus Saccharibacteria bacterium]
MTAEKGPQRGIISPELAGLAHREATGEDASPQTGCLGGAAIHGAGQEETIVIDTAPIESDDNPCIVLGMD